MCRSDIKICMSECCEPKDKGSIGAFYVERSAKKAGFNVERTDEPKDGYDIELISVHHCNDFVRLARMPKRARFRIVGGHPMQNNPLPLIPFCDVIGIGEGEKWIVEVLTRLSETWDTASLSDIEGTIVTKLWKQGDKIPKTRIEDPLPDNPPYLNHPGSKSEAWYIELARGCPYSCSYCELGNSVRYRKYDVEHIKSVIDRCDPGVTRKICFFAPDEASFLGYNELHEYITEKGFYPAQFSSMRIESILKHPPQIPTNHLIRVGIDGMTQATRFAVNKCITDDMIVEYFKMYIDRGHTNFKMFMIFGYEWEKPEDFIQFENLMTRIFQLTLSKNCMLRIKWTPLIPQPCTPLRDSPLNYNQTTVNRIKRWHTMNRQPRRSPGWYVTCDGIMSQTSHRRQYELTVGDENSLQRYRYGAE